MDDFSTSTLYESKNEWSARLLTILTPLIMEGYKSIFDEAVKICKENNEMDKYLMTFQNFISRIPKWNPTIIEEERKRICEKSGCGYLEDLVVCTHIIQLKILTAMRVGQKQKKIDINIPKLDDFIHKIYINGARKIYKNVYLFELNIPPLQTQKHFRELEIIIQECILNTLRDNIPVETILKAYMDETVEEEIIEEIKEEVIPSTNSYQEGEWEGKSNSLDNEKVSSSEMNTANTSTDKETTTSLKFNDIDLAIDDNNHLENIDAPKNIERLEEISEMRSLKRKLESEEEDDGNVKLNISDQLADLNNLDIHVIDPPELNLLPDLLIDDIEVLD
jgi:hypothetical protein